MKHAPSSVADHSHASSVSSVYGAPGTRQDTSSVYDGSELG